MMKKAMYAFVVFLLLGIFFSCEKDDDTTLDTNGPNVVSNIQYQFKDSSVVINWVLPSDADYEKLAIELSLLSQPENKQTIEVTKEFNGVEISGLQNFVDYLITFTAYDNSSNPSEKLMDTIMTEVFPITISGKEIENGIYSTLMDNNQDDIDEEYSHEFYSTDSIKTNSFNLDTSLTEPMPITLYGTWTRKNDSLQIKYTKLEVQGSVMDYDATDIYENAFMYTDNEKTYYYAPALIKTEGNNNSIIGKYSSTQRSYMVNQEGGYFENKITIELIVKKDGTWTQTTTSEMPDIVQPIEENTNGVWTEQDIRDGLFELITFNSKTYIKSNTSILYEKE
ncbi:MAG: hypothetical protein JEZ09_21165 [Salinivirgaceae bacterium]|nr:hypothetical protein [Salinivirgaceae bacterium]